MIQEVKNYVKEIKTKTELIISMNIGNWNADILYGSVTVGHYGFMLEGTWQPQSGTDFQFKMDNNTGEVFEYETKYDKERKPYQSKIILGYYKDFFLKEITTCIKECITWEFNNAKKKRLQKTLSSLSLK